MTNKIKKIKSQIGELSKIKFFKHTFVACIILILLSIAIPVWKLWPEITTKPAVPLHYNIHFGVDLFGVWWRVFMPSIVGIIILIINSVAALIYWTREKMLSKYLFSITVLMELFLVISSIFITLLNLSYD